MNTDIPSVYSLKEGSCCPVFILSMAASHPSFLLTASGSSRRKMETPALANSKTAQDVKINRRHLGRPFKVVPKYKETKRKNLQVLLPLNPVSY